MKPVVSISFDCVTFCSDCVMFFTPEVHTSKLHVVNVTTEMQQHHNEAKWESLSHFQSHFATEKSSEVFSRSHSCCNFKVLGVYNGLVKLRSLSPNRNCSFSAWVAKEVMSNDLQVFSFTDALTWLWQMVNSWQERTQLHWAHKQGGYDNPAEVITHI